MKITSVFSTGKLKGIEQSVAVKTKKGIAVIVGCSHSGVGNILRAASKFGKVYADLKLFCLLNTGI